MTAAGSYRYGIAANRGQFIHQLVQVLLVGLAIGMTRTVVPALAESEFGVARGSFVLLAAFVVAFGVVKGALNLVAGRLSETMGRNRGIASADASPSTWEVLALMSWCDRRLAAISQACLVEKFVDALVWVIYRSSCSSAGSACPRLAGSCRYQNGRRNAPDELYHPPSPHSQLAS